MNTREESKIQILGGLLASLVSFFLLIKELFEAINNASSLIITAPQLVWLIFVLSIATGGITLIVKGASKSSVVRNPSKLILEPDCPDHLLGRENYLDKLIDVCHLNTIVHLIGEPGVGKSALLEGGLLSALQNNNYNLLPLYIDTKAQLESSDLSIILPDAIWNSLTMGEREKLQLKIYPTPDDMVIVLSRISEEIGRIPLIVFDHFDHYVIKYNTNFIVESGSQSSTKDLAYVNPFGPEIEKLLNINKVKLLLVSRDDIDGSIFSKTHTETSHIIRLTRLETQYVRYFLDSLTKQDDQNIIIESPEKGWNKLKQYLVNDLDHNGSVLPVQMRLTLMGLSKMPALSFSIYEKMGGLQGVIAGYIEQQVNIITAGGNLINREQLSSTLKAMVDPETLSPIAHSSQSLLKYILGQHDPSQKLIYELESNLNELLNAYIVRRVYDNKSGFFNWTLHNSYLGESILLINTNTLLLQMEVQYRKFKKAGSSMLKRWSQLLNPVQFIILLKYRILNKFKFNGYRKYFIISSLRLLPYLFPISILSLVFLAELGMVFPGTSTIRDFMYLNKVSLLSEIPRVVQIDKNVKDFKLLLLKELRSRWKLGWFSPEAGTQGPEMREAWIQSQAVFSIMNAKEQGHLMAELCRESIDSLFKVQITTPTGQSYGWSPSKDSGHSFALPVLWTIASLAELNSTVSEREVSDNLDKLYHTQKIAKLYHPSPAEGGEGGWNIFANQVNLNYSCTYTSALALLSLLEVKEAKLQWRDNDNFTPESGFRRRDELILSTASWLINHFREDEKMAGWGVTRERPVDEGLTYFVYSVLLRAEKEADIDIPLNIIRSIPIKLKSILNRPSTYEILTFTDWSGIELTNHNGKIIKSKLHKVRFLWYPYALETSSRWLVRQKVKHDASLHETATVRRVRDYLLMGIGNDVIQDVIANDKFTFMAAELLITLEHVDNFKE